MWLKMVSMKRKKYILLGSSTRWFESTTDLLVTVTVLSEGSLENIQFHMEPLLVRNGYCYGFQGGKHRILAGYTVMQPTFKQRSVWVFFINTIRHRKPSYLLQISISRKGRWPLSVYMVKWML
jgi:hypothetical protein